MLRNFLIVFILLLVSNSGKALSPQIEQSDSNDEITEIQQTLPDQEEGHEIVQVQEESFETEEASELMLFFGRFHPIVVHLPIGFLLFAFLLELMALFKPYEQLKHAVPFALLLGGLSGVAAGVTGYLLSLAGGYGEDLLDLHKWLGISVTVLSFLAFIIRVRFYDNPVLKKTYGVTLVFMVLTLITVGHYGGSLTHGSDYLYRYMPQTLRTAVGLEIEEEKIKLIQDLDSALVYDDVIEPIIRTRCQSCHNEDRKEGELLMTSFDEMMQGGENGPILVANDADESEIYKRLVLPVSDDDHMPPRGRRQLTHDQIKLIAWWIQQGAPSTSMVSALEIPEDISDALDKLTVGGQSFFASTIVPKADNAVIEALREHNIRASVIAPDINFLQVKFNNTADSIKKEDIEMLVPISQQITWLDLSRTNLNDSSLVQLNIFKNLTRLNLQHTDVGDNILEVASSLKNLNYLNLYATKVSDEGLKHLENLTNLKSLYLWQAEVSEEAVADLNEKLPDLYINTGWEPADSTGVHQEIN